MKYVVNKLNKHSLQVIARNLKIAKKEMKRDFPFYKYRTTLYNACNLSGDLGVYIFLRIN